MMTIYSSRDENMKKIWAEQKIRGKMLYPLTADLLFCDEWALINPVWHLNGYDGPV